MIRLITGIGEFLRCNDFDIGHTKVKIYINFEMNPNMYVDVLGQLDGLGAAEKLVPQQNVCDTIFRD